jgi:hypothetical protein
MRTKAYLFINTDRQVYVIIRLGFAVAIYGKQVLQITAY